MERLRCWLALITIDVVWGSTYLAMAVAIETIPPFGMAAIRYILSGLILSVWAGRRALTEVARAPQAWRDALIMGTLMAAVGNGLVAWGQQEVPSGWAALIVSLVPTWTAVLAWVWLGEPPKPAVIIGLMLGLIGVASLVLPGADAGALEPMHVAAVNVAPIGWAAGSLYAQRRAVPAATTRAGMAVQLLGGGVVLAAVSALTGELAYRPWTSVVGEIPEPPGARSRVLSAVACSAAGPDVSSSAGGPVTPVVESASLLALAYLIVFGTIVAWEAYRWLLKHAPIHHVMTYAFVNPLIALSLGVLLRGEPMSASLVAGAILIGVAVVLVVRSTAV